MANKTQVNVSSSALTQSREKLGKICLKMEDDLDKMIKLFKDLERDWESDISRTMIQKQITEINEMNVMQSEAIGNIRAFLTSVDVKYETLSQNLGKGIESGAAALSDAVTSNAEMFK